MFNWLESLSDILTNTGFETARKILTGFEMAERMHLIQITPETFPIYKVSKAELLSLVMTSTAFVILVFIQTTRHVT